MRGIILAAGRGLRLNGKTGNMPKCLMDIGGITLLERQIQSLRVCGIEDITVVVGYEAERVRQACDSQIRFIENTRYDETNSLYSLWMTRELLFDGFIVMNADVLFHPQLLADLITTRYEDVLLIASHHHSDATLGDEEMKVKVRGGCVMDISKTMNIAEADGENVGIVKFGASGARQLVNHMESLIAAGSLKAWAPRAFREFAREHPLRVIDTRGLPWIEIDFPEDYQKAIQGVLPQIPSPDVFVGLMPPFPAAPARGKAASLQMV